MRTVRHSDKCSRPQQTGVRSPICFVHSALYAGCTDGDMISQNRGFVNSFLRDLNFVLAYSGEVGTKTIVGVSFRTSSRI